MFSRRSLTLALTSFFVGAAALAVFAQDVTPTVDPMMPTTDPMMMTPMATMDPMMTMDPAMMGTMDPNMMMQGAFAPILDAAGAQVGLANFVTYSGTKTQVVVALSSFSLTPGFHGLHLHEMGMCDAATNFESAGSHIPGEPTHPNHIGDFPAALVMADGTAYLSFLTDRFTVTDLLDADGAALMLHAGPDNYANIPERYGTPDEETLSTGDSGARIACGVLTAGMGDMSTMGMMGMDMMGNMTMGGMMTDPAMMGTMDPMMTPGMEMDMTATVDPMMPTTDPMMVTPTAGS